MRVRIDRDACISCGLCAQTCPTVFEIASDNLAQVIHQPDSGETEPALLAAESCPVAAIRTED